VTTQTTTPPAWLLGIDFGTTYTCAAVLEEGQARVLQIDGGARIPSAVFREPDGRLLVGQAAERRALLDPDCFEPTPKRYLEVGQEGLLLGGVYVPLREVVGAVLRAVWDEACLQHEGRRPDEVRLTHPASWQQDRQRLLLEAAAEAGIAEPMLLSEPEGALVHLARLDGRTAPSQGSLNLVYDLGGGTFDCAVLRRRGNRFQLIGMPGGDDRIGGVRFDDLLLAELGATGLPSEDWHQLQHSDDPAWRRAAFELRCSVCEAKEAVSKSATHPLLVGAPVSRRLQATRNGFETLICGDVERTLEITERTLAGAGVTAQQLSAIYLVGGSSRIPLVLHMVEERLGPVTFRDDPKTVVALGAVAFDSALTEGPPVTPAEPAKRRAPWIVPAAGTAVALLVALFVILLNGGTQHVAGQAFDSNRDPLESAAVTIRMHSDGAGPDRSYETETDGDGRFSVAAKVDPDNSNATQPTRYSATAHLPYGDGSWEIALDGIPENDGNEDDLKFYANVDGGQFVLDDAKAAEHLDYGPDSVLGHYGSDAVATLHFEPRGKLVDGTEREAFSAQMSSDSFLTILSAGGVGVPLGPWLVSGEIEGDGLSGRLFFETADGEPEAETDIDFAPDSSQVRRNVVLDPADVPVAEPEEEVEGIDGLTEHDLGADRTTP
jgi:hypothetical protein